MTTATSRAVGPAVPFIGDTLEMEPGRVVIVAPMLPYPEVGGGHKRSMRLFEAIERAGGRPHLLVSDTSEPTGAAALRDRGWAVEVFDEPGGIAGRVGQQLRRLPAPYVPELAHRLRELVDDGCAFVQVEHTQCACYAGDLTQVPWVLSLHNVDSQMMGSIARSERPLTKRWLRAANRWHMLRAAERRGVPKATAVLCVSDDDATAFTSTAREVVVAPNGVDDGFFDVPEGDGGEGERVLFFGRFDYQPNSHGIERFIRSGWPAVTAERPGARLRIVGGGIGDGLRALADATPGVEAVGFVDDLQAELAATSVVVVPIWSGGGTRLKVLESLAAARPTVGTRLGMSGIGFQSDVHGLLAESPRDLARGTLELLADPARATELGRGGRGLAGGFRWDEVMQPAERLYRQLFRNRS